MEQTIKPFTNKPDLVKLGKSEIYISTLGMGTWSWGEKFFWNYGGDYNYQNLYEAYEVSVTQGINFIDTAESYGNGLSEQYLGEIKSKINSPMVIATKFMPYPWRLSPQDLTLALKRSLFRLKTSTVDLYQIHWPFPPIKIETWAKYLAQAIDEGMTKTVGVSNYNKNQMNRMNDFLVKNDKHLSSNQVIFNLINRKNELNGLLDACHKNNITFIAYSPIAQGLLSGKYTQNNPPSGIRRLRYSRNLLYKIQPLINLLRDIGNNHDGKTPSQVALNWVICKGAVPIPGAKTAHQAQENSGALGWFLNQEEIELLDNESIKFQSI